MLYSQFKSDADLEKRGVVLEYGFLKKPDGTVDESRPVTFTVARAGGSNSAFTRLMESRIKPYRRQLANEAMDNSVAQKIMREVWAQTVVLGWTNVQDENGQDLPFTAENCVKLFTDLPELFADVQQQSQNGQLYRAELRKHDAGN